MSQKGNILNDTDIINNLPSSQPQPTPRQSDQSDLNFILQTDYGKEQNESQIIQKLMMKIHFLANEIKQNNAFTDKVLDENEQLHKQLIKQTQKVQYMSKNPSTQSLQTHSQQIQNDQKLKLLAKENQALQTEIQSLNQLLDTKNKQITVMKQRMEIMENEIQNSQEQQQSLFMPQSGPISPQGNQNILFTHSKNQNQIYQNSQASEQNWQHSLKQNMQSQFMNSQRNLNVQESEYESEKSVRYHQGHDLSNDKSYQYHGSNGQIIFQQNDKSSYENHKNLATTSMKSKQKMNDLRLMIHDNKENSSAAQSQQPTHRSQSYKQKVKQRMALQNQTINQISQPMETNESNNPKYAKFKKQQQKNLHLRQQSSQNTSEINFDNLPDHEGDWKKEFQQFLKTDKTDSQQNNRKVQNKYKR